MELEKPMLMNNLVFFSLLNISNSSDGAKILSRLFSKINI